MLKQSFWFTAHIIFDVLVLFVTVYYLFWSSYDYHFHLAHHQISQSNPSQYRFIERLTKGWIQPNWTWDTQQYTLETEGEVKDDYEIALAADLDLQSRDPNKLLWYSYIQVLDKVVPSIFKTTY
jgi:hypothetical protein